MADLAPPSATLVAGKYRLIREIGRGGMGAVWEAQHATLGTLVAVKFIDASYAESMEARLRFDNEARAAASLQSKHAIQIFDHGVTEDGRPYIVMELLVGEALDKRLDRLGRLSLHDTAKILIQVCRGLGRAHERGITHRDLKPENIFLVRAEDDDSDDERAKILDFGIAKMRSAEGISGLTSGTKTGAVLGTPYFMSPEQARGLKEIDHRTDLWSLGIIAYKCVIGVLPFEGQAIGDLLVKICTSPPPVPSRHNPDLPPAFDAWFARTMEREPDRRFQTAAELADGLAFAAGLGMRGRPSFDGGRAGSPVSGGGSPAYTPQINTAVPVAPMAPPHGPGMGTGPAPTPQMITPGDYRAALTPPPGTGHGVGPAGGPAVTSAPFTTSMYPSGVPRSRHVLAWSIAAVLGIGSAVSVVAYLYLHKDDDTKTAHVEATTLPSASASPSGATPSAAGSLAASANAVAGGGASGTSGATVANAADAGALLPLAGQRNGGHAEPAGGTPPVAANTRPGHSSTPQQSPWVMPIPVPVPYPVPAARSAAPPSQPPPNQGRVTDQSGF